MAETDARVIADAARQTKASHLFAAATPYGKGVLPRVAALLDVMQLSDVVRVDGPDCLPAQRMPGAPGDVPVLRCRQGGHRAGERIWRR
ncbi:hypothetical protein HK414_22240 [Ramlibacter terrae]|uniref:Electron transfer flavoprotein alpha/beta-subunit N-terminal domain-containing protein n=1 Tax=Ramlibacter terrae TaxID=2732511 RepID=A0ABX6P6M8_9BURK|nr:hypothetical protein HK414_22240 [Ramlibacter terrae]